jgi:hypothetical protein
MVLIAPSRFKIIRPISGQTFRLDPAGDYGSSPLASSAEAMSSSSSSAREGVKPCRTSPFGNGAVRRGAWSTLAADD